MSLVIDKKTGDPVHYPKRRDVFEFDDEVAPIFENMAVRSIPLYAEVHRQTAAFIEHHMNNQSGRRAKEPRPYTIVDYGASTGMTVKALCNRLQIPIKERPKGLRYVAIDVSQPMLAELERTIPWAETHLLDMTQIEKVKEAFDEFAIIADFAVMHYFLQFIRPTYKQPVIEAAIKNLKMFGMLAMSQKESPKVGTSTVVTQVANDEYIRFRKDNGYSDKEITVKTHALKKSMYPVSRQSIINMLYNVGLTEPTEIARWFQFSSFICTKARRKF